MKKLNKFFVLIILAGLTFSAGAQVNFGIKVGGNLSDIHQDYKDSDWEVATKLKPGFHIGIIADVPFSDNFSFQPGLLFTNKGTSFDMDEYVDDYFEGGSMAGVEIDGYVRTNLNYIEIPLHLAFKANDLQIFAGPYVAMGIGGKHKMDFEVSFMGQSETMEEEMKLKPTFGEVNYDDLGEDEDAFTALDYGLNFGLGYMVGPVLIQGGYSLGLGNLTAKYEGMSDTDRSDFKESNRVITLSLSYFFGN